LPVWQELYESIGSDRFEMISVAQDSGGAKAVDKWFDRASPTYRCVIDTTHQISSLFGWVNVPSAAWIDEQGRIVRSNEGTYPGEFKFNFGLGKLRAGDDAFAEATRDWVNHGAESKYVLSSTELAATLRPVTRETLLAEAEFKLALHFKAQKDTKRAQKHFAAAQQLAPDNWCYMRQDWVSRGIAYSDFKTSRLTSYLRKNTDDARFYNRKGLPDEDETRFITPEWIWTPALRRIKQRLRR